MSVDFDREALIRELEDKLEQVLQADYLSEAEKIAALKQALAIAVTRKEEGVKWQL